MPVIDKTRLASHFQALGCKFGLYISRRKKLNDQWAIGWTKHTDHNHQGLADPFLHPEFRSYRPSHAKALRLANTHRGILSYKDLARVLEKAGLYIRAKEFWNLQHKEKIEKLSSADELNTLVGNLKRAGFHPRMREEYLVEDRARVRRVVRDIFFMSDEQIRLTRRFVSGFIYETDATFNTNTLRLPLSVIVGINNTGSTFPIALMFITSKAAKSF
jgi:hypothetical protein